MKYFKKQYIIIAMILFIWSFNIVSLCYENESDEILDVQAENVTEESEILDTSYNTLSGNPELTVQANNNNVAVNNTTIKTLYTLPSVSDIAITGTNRGNGHDKQHLDMYMPAGSSFEIRQVSSNTNLTLSCLNNDSQTEKSYTIPKTGGLG